MLKKPLLISLLALMLFGGFFAGLAHLFALRYGTGDVYPHYSSLRADPLGTKILFQSLDELPGIAARRNFKELSKLHPPAPVTLVYSGVAHDALWTKQELQAFDALVLRGSRALFAFAPVKTPASESSEKTKETAKEKSPRKKEKTAEKADGKKDGEADETKAETVFVEFEAVAKHLGFAFDFLPEEKGKSFDRRAALVEPGGKLEPEIGWHSALCFRDLKPSWKVLYLCGTQPVVIERKYGDGSIVLAADSFFVSNEAMRAERLPRLLARLFSGPPDVVFDEEHFGLRDNPGIAMLVRKYRLHGVIATLGIIAAFFVWKNATRFLPALPTSHAAMDFVAGRESAEGFVNLLRRSIPPSEILGVCVGEWRKTFARKPRELAKVEELWAQEQTRLPRQQNAVQTYRAIAESLTRR